MQRQKEARLSRQARCLWERPAPRTDEVRRLIDYINTGSTENCVNFPAIRLPPHEAQNPRFLHEKLTSRS